MNYLLRCGRELVRSRSFHRDTMGYIIVLVLGVGLLAVAIIALSKQSKGSMDGQLPRDKVLGADRPAADEPTPGASSTSSAAKVQAAQKHTPPA